MILEQRARERWVGASRARATKVADQASAIAAPHQLGQRAAPLSHITLAGGGDLVGAAWRIYVETDGTLTTRRE